jgi:hypothetical protein
MKRLLSLILIACIIGQASVRTLWSVHYQLDRAAYVKQCENKDKPSLHCDGKCYLKKQMQETSPDNSKEPRLPEGFHQIKDLQLFCESLLTPSLVCFSETKHIPLPVYHFALPGAPLSSVFRPPA